MTELHYKIVDVFSDRAFAGNGLCVVEGILDDTATMQAIARAMNLSETVFVQETGEWAYDVRIFTPTEELPLAGHPTIGAAWTRGRAGRWTQRSSGATVSIDVAFERATMFQPDPVLTEVYPEDAAQAMAIPVQAARRAFVADLAGTRHLIVPTDHPLGQVRFDAALCAAAARAVKVTGVAAMRRLDDSTVQLRLAVPGETMTFEDPGTGSAAGPVGLLARRLWGMGEDVVVRQGAEVGRPCAMHVHAVEGDVRVGGAVHHFASGMLTFE